MKKLEQLKKLLNSPHISEDMKKKTKEAIEKLEKGTKDRKGPLTNANIESIVLNEGLSYNEKLKTILEEFSFKKPEAEFYLAQKSDLMKGVINTIQEYEGKPYEVESLKVIENAKAKKATRKGNGVKALLKDKPKKGGTPDNCDEILENLKKRKAQSKKSSKKAAVKAKAKEKAHDKYPELDNLIDSLAGDVTKKIKTITEKVESKMPYKEQYVLEELIKELQSRV